MNLTYTAMIANASLTWREVASAFWPVMVVSLGVALIATPLCRRFAMKKAIVDRPDDFLKPHGQPIPYLGGVAIFLGWLGGIVVACLTPDIQLDTWIMLAVAVSGLGIMLVGLFDDLRVMSPVVKLTCNIAVAAVLIVAGLGDDLVNVIAQVAGVTFSDSERWLQLAYSVPVTLFIIVATCNATNLIDGLDGLCAGVLGIIAVGFFVLAAHMLIIYPEAELSRERLVLALAMCGGAAGFLPFNRNPAKIFMGDAGSMLLGLNAAILVLMFGEAHMVRWMAGALMVFGLPITDMLLTLMRRWRNGKPLMTGDRSHYYDQLRDRGYTVRQVVAISYVLSILFALAGISVIWLRTRHLFLVYFFVMLLIVALIWKFDMTSIESDRNTSRKASHGA